MLIAYFGHHRCASQWMKGLIRGIAQVVARDVHRYWSPRDFNYDLTSVADPGATIVVYSNANVRYVKGVSLRGFHMVRDPRDIAVSSYFSHLYSHPTEVYSGADSAPVGKTLTRLEEYRRTLRSMSKDEGLSLELEQRSLQYMQMKKWDYSQENVLELRMEEVTSDPLRWLREIATFVGLYGVRGLDDERLASIVAANDFRVYTGGRVPGEEDVRDHYRKGTPGDWKLHFGPGHVEYFKEHYNDLLLKLGYEHSPNWG
jgi:hypothetical protein